MIATFFHKTKPFITISLFLLLAFGCFSLAFAYNNNLNWNVFWEGVRFFLANAFALYMLIFTIKNHKITLKNSYASLFFLLILFSFVQNTASNAKLLSLTALSFAFYKIYGLYGTIKTQKNIFDSAFWIGVAFLFHFWSFLFLLLLFFSVFKNEKNNIKNILAGVVGFIAPVFLFFTYHFYFDNLSAFYQLFPNHFSFSLTKYVEFPIIMSTTLTLSLIVLSVFIVFPKATSIGKKFTTLWSVLLFHLIVGVLTIGFSAQKSTEDVLFLLFPMAIIFAILCQNISKKIIKEAIIYLFVIIVLYQFIHILYLK